MTLFKGQKSFVLSTGIYGAMANQIYDQHQALLSKPYNVLKDDRVEDAISGDTETGKVEDVTRGDTDTGEVEDVISGDTDTGEVEDVISGDTASGGGLTLWGPTCDGTDVLLPGYEIPDLDTGDWIAFPDQGAYGSMSMTNFNGFDFPEIKFVFSNVSDSDILHS